VAQPVRVIRAAAATSTVDPAVSEPRRSSVRALAARIALTQPATRFVVVACFLAAWHFVFLLSDYKNVFVHPDFHQANLGFVMRSGLSIGLNDFIDILQQREAGEFRPRWLMFYLETLDHKIRMQLYQWMPVYPTLGPVTWPLQLLLTPYLLYKLIMRLTADRMAALVSVAVYISSTGFLSGFTMALMPGKTLSNLVYIAAFYFAVIAAERLRPGQYLVESKGSAKYLLILVLTLGLFLDELPVATFLMVPVMFWRYFFPQRLSPRAIVRFVWNGLYFAAPVLVFLVIVLVVVPPITERYLNYRFDYLADLLPSASNTRIGGSLLVGPKASLSPTIVLENFTTPFGVSLAPWVISPFVQMPWGTYPGTQVNNLPKLLIFLVFFGAVALIAVRARGAFGMYFRGLLAAIVVFGLFLSLLSIRHIPIVTGFYYGASFASLFSILVGMLFAGISDLIPKARPDAALAVIAIVAVQIANFWPINDGWIYTHNEVMSKARVLEQSPRFQRRYPLEPGRPLSAAEVNGIWTAWKQGRMQQYVRSQRLSPAASYEVFELRELDRLLLKQGPNDGDEDD
jgi:hypothetical protein